MFFKRLIPLLEREREREGINLSKVRLAYLSLVYFTKSSTRT